MDAPPTATLAELRLGTDPFRYMRRRTINVASLLAGDLVALAFGIFLAGLVRWLLKGDDMIPRWAWALAPAWIFGAYMLRLLPGWGLGAAEELRRQVLLLVVVFAMATIALFLVRAGTAASRLTLSSAFLLCLPLVPLMRTLVKRLLIRHNLWGMPAAIYGSDDRSVELIIRSLQEEQGLGYFPVAVFSPLGPAGRTIAGIPVVGRVTERTHAAPVAIVGMPGMSRHDLIELLDNSLSTYPHVLLIPDLFEAPSLWVQSRDLRGILGLEITQNLLDPYARYLKRIVDLALVLAALPLWAPLCLLLAIVVYLEDRHSPFFIQERIGRDGRTFRTLKFRTMHKGSEQILEKQLDEDPELRREWERSFKLRKDPRVTRMGRLLRKTSLDELPQLANVLRGEMALVGPRPLPAYHYYELPQRVRVLRDRVRPGMTGLWQVSGRSEAGIEGMERWDTYYVRNWSIWLDIVILFRTFRVVLKREGAY